MNEIVSEQDLLKMLIDADLIDSKIDFATHIIVGSEILKRAVMKVGVKGEKITVLGERIDTSVFKPLPHRPKTTERGIRLLFIGRQEPQKNLHGVISAANLLTAQGFDLQLNIVGGGSKKEYTRRLLTPETRRFCRFLGSVRNLQLPFIFNKVDMLVNPSFFEGFQVPLIEALACGVPAVTSNQEPSNSIISEETGALVDPSDPQDIARGILSVKERLNDPMKRLRLKVKCRIEALTKWDYTIVSKNEVEAYKKVLHQK